MKNKRLQHLLILLLALIPPVYIIAIWASIPEVVPTHFDMHNEPNGYSSKSGLLTISFGLAGVAMLVYFLMQYIYKVDPKQSSKTETPTVFNVLGVGLAAFLTALNFNVVTLSAHQGKLAERSLMPLIGLLFTFLGAVMSKVPPNYLVGVRIPWTLSSDNNWRKTHELTGKIWFAGGIIFTVAALLLPSDMTAYLMIGFIAVCTIIPIGYSFSIFRKESAEMDRTENK